MRSLYNSEDGEILVMAEAALALDFLVLEMIFSLLLSKESVKAPAPFLATLVTGSPKSSWNTFWSWTNWCFE